MAFQSKSPLSKQSASYMDRVSEHSEEEDEALGPATSVTSEDKDGQGSQESFQVGEEESKQIRRSKALLILLIVAFAGAMGCLTYYVARDQEHQQFIARFNNIAMEITEFAQVKTKHVFNNLELFSVSLTSYAQDQNMTWPFVVFPDFQVKGILSNQETGSHTISVNPFVMGEDLYEWNQFSRNNQQWMTEAHVYDRIVHKELYTLDYYNTSDDHHDPATRWNETGITPYAWYTEGARGMSFTGERQPVKPSTLHTPIWQRAPPCDYSPQINMDLESDPVFARFIEGMIATNHPVITQVVDATYLDTNYESRFDPTEQAEPHSYILEPVYHSLAENRTMVAFLAAFMRWGAFFTDVLPDHEQGIFVVFTSDCGEVFTYEIFGHNAVYIGEGDLHDIRQGEAAHLFHEFEFAPFSSLEKEGEHRFCHYYARIYPSHQWKSQFYTNRPITYALAAVSCFLVTTICFLAYDHLVQQRQRKVMASAKRTNAIVVSLFPENVRDRLLQGIDNSEKKHEKSKGSRFQQQGPWSDPTAACLNGMSSCKGDELTSERIFGSKPIADLFPATTIMFADLVGFTAWSSVREPHQVFSLLETVYHAFDVVAKRRRVFKVETIGDCYVAVAGLPYPRKEHATVMCKFATDCMDRMKHLVKQLETSLGPDTAELDMRFGLHSGPVTAGVLRGDKGRFQLFGDTMNTASRLESTGWAGRIHISRDTAELLVASGKEKWVTPREDPVFAKGKGNLQTYWMTITEGSTHTASNSNATSSLSAMGEPGQAKTPVVTKQKLVLGEALLDSNQAEDDPKSKSAIDELTEKRQRLVHWNVDLLVKTLRQIVARRQSQGNEKTSVLGKSASKCTKDDLFAEVKAVLALPQFDAKAFQNHVDPNSIQIPDKVVHQLTDMVARIAGLYRNNPFHSFEHASHVTMSVTKLLSRIINPNEISTQNGTNDQIASDLHDHTFGITSDPLTQFACILSALIHDADHPGVPNSTLVREEHPLASKYKNKSVAEQNSVDLAWDIITCEDYKELQECIYATADEHDRFRSIIVNVVMATDIMDKDLGAQRKARWEKAFAQEEEEEADTVVAINRKATIVLEHLMQASDVSHTMQHWVVFKKWNERLFVENYQAFVEGRSDRDPSQGWYRGELGFFDYYIIPLAKKLETCGVFGVSSHEYLSYAQANRREWEEKGDQIVKDYVARFHVANPQPSSRKQTDSELLSCWC